MNKSSVITTRIDPDLKAGTDAIFSDLGITTAQAITMFLKQVELHKAIPFELKLPKKPKARIAGLNRGQSEMSEDFDAPLDDAFWMGEA